jgi:hypothetical protein
MCFHKRLIHLECGHSLWCQQVLACADLDCDTMLSHPFHTLKRSTLCESCLRKKLRTSAAAKELRQRIRRARLTIAGVARAPEEQRSLVDEEQRTSSWRTSLVAEEHQTHRTL